MAAWTAGPARGVLQHAARHGGAKPWRALLILVSLDAFRWDYLEKAPTPNLHALARRGVRAQALIPVFPAKTFPNHYTIVTGLYPEHHGIVGNSILDPPTHRRFDRSNTTEVGDAMWWGGEPIWVTAERSGRHAGTMFWPGSEAPIGGVRPTEWRPFAQSMTGTARVESGADLARPALVSASRAAHPLSRRHRLGRPCWRSRLGGSARRYRACGRIRRAAPERTGASGSAGATNVVIVSDHGMAATVPTQIIELDRYVRLSEVEIVDINPGFGLFPAPGRADAVYRALKPAHPRLRVFRRKETPPAWHYRTHPRIPPIIGLSDEGWQVSTGSSANRLLRTLRPERGAHGYDPSLPSMHGILIAAGPAFKQGVTVPAMENVHVYDVLASVLGVTPAPNDGDMKVARRLLQ